MQAVCAKGHVVAPSMFVKQIKHILDSSPAEVAAVHMAQKLKIRKHAYITILNGRPSPFNMQIS